MAQVNKGDRDLMVTRPPKGVGQAVRVFAAAHGVSISEAIASILAERFGMPDAVPLPPQEKKQELPLTG